MNQIIENQSGQSEEHPSGGPTKLVAKGESDGSNELRGNPDSGFIGDQLNASLTQVKRLQKIITERKSPLLFAC